MNVSHETKYMRFHRQLHEAGLRINPVALKCADADYNIMLLRVCAAARGASPIDIQKAVQTLGGE